MRKKVRENCEAKPGTQYANNLKIYRLVRGLLLLLLRWPQLVARSALSLSGMRHEASLGLIIFYLFMNCG